MSPGCDSGFLGTSVSAHQRAWTPSPRDPRWSGQPGAARPLAVTTAVHDQGYLPHTCMTFTFDALRKVGSGQWLRGTLEVEDLDSISS